RVLFRSHRPWGSGPRHTGPPPRRAGMRRDVRRCRLTREVFTGAQGASRSPTAPVVRPARGTRPYATGRTVVMIGYSPRVSRTHPPAGNAEPGSHCSACGTPYGPGVTGWPRTCPACGTTAYRNPLPVAVALQPVYDTQGTGLVVITRTIPPARGGAALPAGFLDDRAGGPAWPPAAATCGAAAACAPRSDTCCCSGSSRSAPPTSCRPSPPPTRPTAAVGCAAPRNSPSPSTPSPRGPGSRAATSDPGG